MLGLFALSKFGCSSCGVSAPLSSAGDEAREESPLVPAEVCAAWCAAGLVVSSGSGAGTCALSLRRMEGRDGSGRSGAGLGGLLKRSRSRLVVLRFAFGVCVGRKVLGCRVWSSVVGSGSMLRPRILAAFAPLMFILRGVSLSE